MKVVVNYTLSEADLMQPFIRGNMADGDDTPGDWQLPENVKITAFNPRLVIGMK